MKAFSPVVPRIGKIPLGIALRWCGMVVCALSLGACLAVDSIASTMRPVPEARTKTVFVLTETHDITLDTGYHRSLVRGSQWVLAGEIDEGTVYKPTHGVFTLEGADVVEAYLVVSNNRLVGFYVPKTKGFSPLDHQVLITFSTENH